MGLLASVEPEVARLSWDDVLAPYVYVFYASFIVAFLFTPVMRVVASYYGIVDKPDGRRKLHREPVAYLGGVAVFLGWIAGLAIALFLVWHRVPWAETLPPRIPSAIVLAGIIIVVLGFIDDVRGIRPWIKIGGQVLAALMLVWQGIGTESLKPILGNLNERLQLWFHGMTGPDIPVFIPEWAMYAASVGLVVALVVFCCNAANLMDGMDGLCGGVTAIIALGYVFLAVHVATLGSQFGPNEDAVRIIISLALLGGVLGFVPFNFNPASIFMGDAGSMFLGFCMAVLMLMLGEVASKWLLAALVMFALPTLDTALAFVRRFVNKRPFFSPDKHHIHHQFLARGMSVKQTVLFLYGSAVLFMALGSAIAVMRTRYAIAMYLVIFGSIIVAAFKMGMVHERVTAVDKPNPIGPDDTISNRSEPGVGVMEIRDPKHESSKQDPAPA